jgi:hypothetical protein
LIAGFTKSFGSRDVPIVDANTKPSVALNVIQGRSDPRRRQI